MNAVRRWMAAASGLLVLALLLAGWQAHRQPQAVALVPTLSGEVEYCLTCHAGLAQISASHPLETFGCVLCHGGERLALEADLAHSSMRGGANPSDLAVAAESCGGQDCHSGGAAQERDHVQRVLTSIQATYAGAIANMRYTYGAQPDLQAIQGIRAVRDAEAEGGVAGLAAFDPALESVPALQAFAANCLYCHLYAQPMAGAAYARYTGCAACHTPAAPLDSGSAAAAVGEAGESVHTLTTAIPYTQCNTCHNRGNYDLRAMTFVARDDHPASRLQDYYQPIAQFTRCEYTLDCVDCHTRLEAMGDGHLHNNQKEIQYVQCQTCHGTLEALPLTATLDDPDDLAFRLANINPVIDLALGDTILVTPRGEPLWNMRALADGTYELFGKATGQRVTLRAVIGTDCLQEVNQQESHYCHECHAMEHQP